MAITKVATALYTTDGTTLTRVDTTADTTSGFLDTNNTRYEQGYVTGTVILNPGQVYYVGIIVNASTPGTVQGFVEAANIVSETAEEGPPPMYTLAAQTSLGATHAISGLTATWDLVPSVTIKGTAAA